MEALVVTYHCKPGKREEFVNAIRAEGIDKKCAAEKGNLRYEYAYSLEHEDDLILLENWETAENVTSHGQQAHYKRLGELKAIYVNDTVLDRYHKD